jgi:tyrosine-protein phosphatase SIW14
LIQLICQKSLTGNQPLTPKIFCKTKCSSWNITPISEAFMMKRINPMTCWFRLTKIVALALLFPAALLCSDLAFPQTKEETQSPKERAIGRRLDEKGVPNFGQVTPNLYRGGLLNTTGLKALARMGVTIVVDTHANDANEEKEVRRLGMQYVAIPWHCPWPKDEVFAKFLKLIEENKGKKVFVHCRLGDDRTGMMVAAYRMAEEGWTADEAMIEMRSFGFTRAHHFLCPSLAGYEKGFPERLKNSAAFEEVRRKQ